MEHVKYCLKIFSLITKDLYRFYDAMPGYTWLVNATQFGHADCLDETFASGIEVGKISSHSKTIFTSYRC